MARDLQKIGGGDDFRANPRNNPIVGLTRKRQSKREGGKDGNEPDSAPIRHSCPRRAALSSTTTA